MRASLAAALCLALAAVGAAAAADAGTGEAKIEDGVSWQDELTLLAADSVPADRAASLARTLAAAEAGHADAAFLLGVLYRSGEGHPAKAVARDPAQARRWLERCIDTAHCTPVALYSLAELELTARDAARAVQWAQMAVIFDRELARVDSEGTSGTSGYLPGLLARAFAALPKAERTDANVKTLLAALVEQRGEALARMLDRGIANRRSGRDASHPWPKHPGKAGHLRRGRVPDAELYSLYSLEIPAVGGRASRVTMVEGLPRPREARDLDHIAAQQEFVAFTPVGGASSGGAWLPVTYDTRRYKLRSD